MDMGLMAALWMERVGSGAVRLPWIDEVGEALVVVGGTVDVGGIEDVDGGVVVVQMTAALGFWLGQSSNAMDGVSRFEM
jgi:hypothetical protein